MASRNMTSALHGRHASVVKYDILAALGAAAFAKGALAKDLAHRLSVLIVARYNWLGNELSIGRQQLAQLWNVDERRVKRLIGDLKSCGVLSVKRPGVRGRVTVYSLDLHAIAEITRPFWSRLGPDFVARLDAHFPEGTAEPCGESVSDAGQSPHPTTDTDDHAEPGRPETSASASVERVLKAVAKEIPPPSFRRWIAPLRPERDREKIVFRADNAFMAHYVEREFGDLLARTARRLFPDVTRVAVEADSGDVRPSPSRDVVSPQPCQILPTRCSLTA
jgi:hypothetical protein